MFNSQAIGMAAKRPYNFKINFVRNPILDQLHDYSLLSLNSFLHPFIFNSGHTESVDNI